MLFHFKHFSIKNKDKNTVSNVAFRTYAVGNLPKLVDGELHLYGAFYDICQTHAPDCFCKLSLEIERFHQRFFQIIKIIVCSI